MSDINSFKFIDLFAGIGGFHLAMHENGGKCVYASEIDKYARQTYLNNFKNISPDLFEKKYFNKDITDSSLKYNIIPDFDILCAGFPCQAFSIAGYREGFNDRKGRGNLFFNILDILRVKKPKAFLLENVKNLRTHDNGITFQTICSHLTSLGYGIKTQVLNAKDYGIHQNRERIFIVGIRDCWNSEKIPLPNLKNTLTYKEIDRIIELNNIGKIKHFDFDSIQKSEVIPFYKINSDNYINAEYSNEKIKYINPEKIQAKYFQKFQDRNDWGDFIYNGKAGHFNKAVTYINEKIMGLKNKRNWENWSDEAWVDNGYNYFYQWRRKYIRRNNSGVSPTLTANMGTGGHNVPLVICGEYMDGQKLIRKLTPEECFAIQGYSWKFISNMTSQELTNGQLYKQAGNSVPYKLLYKISNKLIDILYG